MKFKVGDKIMAKSPEYGITFIVAGEVVEVVPNGEGTIASLPFYLVRYNTEVFEILKPFLPRQDGIGVVLEMYARPYAEDRWLDIWNAFIDSLNLKIQSEALYDKAIRLLIE
jgi:hypothetical protein